MIGISEFSLIVHNNPVYYIKQWYISKFWPVRYTNYMEPNKPPALSFGQIDPIKCYAWVSQ